MDAQRRRFFQKFGALVATVALAPYLVGCSALTDLKAWIPIALAAVAAIVKLLGPVVPLPVSAIITLIQAGFAALLAAIESYQSGKGVLADITNAIAAIEAHFQSFFAALNVPLALLNLIEGLTSIILSTIQAFANELSPGTTTTGTTARVGGHTIAITPKKRNVAQFRSAFNAECVSGGHPEAQL